MGHLNRWNDIRHWKDKNWAYETLEDKLSKQGFKTLEKFPSLKHPPIYMRREEVLKMKCPQMRVRREYPAWMWHMKQTMEKIGIKKRLQFFQH